MKKIRLSSNNRGRLTFRNRSLLHTMVFLISFWWSIINLTDYFPGPTRFIKYLPDGVLLVLLVLVMFQSSISYLRTLRPVVITTICLFVYTLLVYLFNYQSTAYYLWGFRNNFRFYIAFFAFVAFLDEADVDSWFKIADVLFWINAVVSVIQFVFLGFSGDDLGGIFGVATGSNGYTLAFLCIMVGRAMIQMFSGRGNISGNVWKCIVALVVAAMAELKVFIVLFVLILAMAAVFARLSVKNIVLLILGAMAVFWGASLLTVLFGGLNILSLDRIIELATKESYSSDKDLNRLAAIPTLMNTLVTDPLQQLFGMGLGNCDTSAFPVCKTPFYQRYSYLHYTWFSSAMLFLEIGLIGLVIYVLFYVHLGKNAFEGILKRSKYHMDYQLAFIMAVISLILLFYNSSLRDETAYMIYFVLAIPYIKQKSGRVPAQAKPS